MIDVVNCTHHYGIRPVLKDVNLRINTGEVVALMGPNGMGKTTLLSIMAGILAPTRGYVEIDGLRRRRTPQEEAAIRAKVIYIPTDMWLPSLRSGHEWLAAVGRLYGLDEVEMYQHAAQLLELFDLAKLADSRLASYSSGQRKKITLAAALITKAPILMIDEPFAGGLDPSGILAFKQVINRMRRTRKFTIVMTSPVPELVEEITDRVAFLRDGQLVAFDTIDGLRKTHGVSGSLDQIYHQLVSPENAAKIQNYFDKAGL